MLTERDLINTYPRPIVEAYRRAQAKIASRAASARDKVTGLNFLAETITKYTAILTVAQYCALGLQDRDAETDLRKFARDPGRMAFGSWLGLLQHLVPAFEQSGFKTEAIVSGAFLRPTYKGELLDSHQILQSFLNRYRPGREPAKAHIVSAQHVLEALIQLRNTVAHETTLTDEDLNALDYSRLLAMLRNLLGEMSFLAEKTLVYIERVSRSGGKYIHEARVEMGAASLAREPFELERPLDEERFYIFDAAQEVPLVCLGPLLGYVDDDISIVPEALQEQLRRIDSAQRHSLFGLISSDSVDKYREAVRDVVVVEGGTIPAADQRHLDRLANSLGLPAWLARQIEEEIKAGVVRSPSAPLSSAALNVEWEMSLGKPVRQLVMSRLSDAKPVWVVVGEGESGGDSIYLLDGKSQRLLPVAERSRIESLACAEREPICAVGYWNGHISIFDGHGRSRRGPPNLGGVVKALALSADGTKLAATTWSEEAYLFDLESDRVLRQETLTDAGRCVAVSPAADCVAVGTYHGSIVTFDPDGVKLLEEVGDPVAKVAMAEDHKVIAAHPDGRIISFTKTGRQPYQVGGPITDLVASRDGHTIVAAHSGRYLSMLREMGGHLQPAHASDPELDGDIVRLALSDDGRWCCAATMAGTLYVFDEARVAAQWKLEHQPVDLALSADARQAALAFSDGIVRLLTLPAEIVPVVTPWLEVIGVSAATTLRCNKWSVVEVLVRNTGDGAAREVTARIAGPVDVKPPHSLDLPPDHSDKIKLNVYAREPGDLLLDFEIEYKDYANALYTEITYRTDTGALRKGARFQHQFKVE